MFLTFYQLIKQFLFYQIFFFNVESTLNLFSYQTALKFFQKQLVKYLKPFVPVGSDFKESWSKATKSIKNDRAKEKKIASAPSVPNDEKKE
jgi:hypothetical protein